jgi:hypothetical protein
MRHAFLLVSSDFISDDGQALVHLDGIAVDDFAVECSGQLHRQLAAGLLVSNSNTGKTNLRFPCPRRPNDGDNRPPGYLGDRHGSGGSFQGRDE